MLGGLGGNADAGSIIRTLLAFQDTRNLAELTTDLDHHLLCGTAHGIHGKTTEQEGHHGTQEDAHENHRVHQRNIIIFYDIGNGRRNRFHGPVAHFEHRLAHVGEADLDFLDIRGQQGEGGQGGGTDGKALSGSSRRIAEGVEDIGFLTYRRIQFGHLGVTAGIVGDGAVRIRSQGDSQRGKHTDGSDGDPVQAHAQRIGREAETRCEAVGQDNGNRDGHHRDGRRNHAQAHTVDDHGRRTRLGTLGQFLRGLIGMGGIIFGSLADDNAGQQTGEHRQGHLPPVGEAQQAENAEGHHRNQDRAQVGAHAQGAQQVFQRSSFLGADGVDTQDGQDNAHGGNQHRGHDGAQLHIRTLREERGSTQCHGGEDGTAIGLVQVGTHTGHVAHVVAHVIGDGRRVAGIVLRDILLHLADDIGTYVGGLGIDTAAHTGEQGLRRSTHSEGQHRGGDDHQGLCFGSFLDKGIQDDPPEGNIKQAESHDGKSHNGTAAESDLKTGIERTHGCVGRTRRGVRCGLHADETRQAGEETAGQEGERDPRILYVETIGQDGKDDSQYDENDDHHFVLLTQIRHGAFANVLGNFFHGHRSLALLHHLMEEEPGKEQGNQRCRRHQIE